MGVGKKPAAAPYGQGVLVVLRTPAYLCTAARKKGHGRFASNYAPARWLGLISGCGFEPLLFYIFKCYNFEYERGCVMVRCKNPLLSFGARGSLGKDITFTERRGSKIVEIKPRLPYFLTLPSAYQRWLYQDYCSLWGTLTPAEKVVYRSDGVHYHRTAFQQFMSYHLTNLPDICGLWHLDHVSGGVTFDNSCNGNHGTVIGASPADGVIAGALSFDGLNDRVSIDHHSTLNPVDAVSVSVFVSFATLISEQPDTYPNLVEKGDGTGANRAYILYVRRADRNFYWGIGTDAEANVLPDWPANSWHHIACTYDRSLMSVYFDGVLASAPKSLDIPVPFKVQPLRFDANYDFKGRLDHVVVYNRCLTAPQVYAQSLRRYSLK